MDGENATPLLHHTVSSGPPIDRIRFSPDNTQIAAVNLLGPMNAVIWELDGNLTRILHEFTDVAYSPNGKQIAFASADGTVRIIEIGSGEVTKSLKAHDGMIASLKYSPDGRSLAFLDPDGVRVWDIERGERALSISDTGQFDSRENRFRLSSFAFSPNGREIVTAGFGVPVVVWDANSGESLRTLRERSNVFSVAYSPDGKQIAIGGEDGVELRDAATATYLSSIDLDDDPFPLISLGYSPDGTKLAIGGGFGFPVIRHLKTNEMLALTGELDGGFFQRLFLQLQQLREGRSIKYGVDEVRFTFSPDGTRIAFAENDLIRVWDTQTGEVVATRNVEPRIVTAVRFSADGESLAFGRMDWTITEWHIASDRITTYSYVDEWLRELAQPSSDCSPQDPIPAHTAIACLRSRLAYGTGTGTVVLSKNRNQENDDLDETVFQCFPLANGLPTVHRACCTTQAPGRNL